ncbi:MAG: DNA-protecting protein DprA [Planctomycetes bacterium]|nr:DNA-protecting protein DprA [Planctomycetota bacterium]
MKGSQADRAELVKWLRLHLCDEVGSITFVRLLEAFGSIDAVLGASAGQLAKVERVGAKRAEKIASSRDRVDAEGELALADRLGVEILTLNSEAYPKRLREILDRPVVLYVKGELLSRDSLSISIVGSRYCSHYGLEQASRLSHELAGMGFTIVSGLARGIDTAAHRGALTGLGRTIGVQACGLSMVYPEENRDLAKRIARSGAVVSELPLRFEPLPRMFPARNRIVSGLSVGTIVVEAGKRSGAMITARLAMEQNREVMAVPGRVDSPGSFGCHQLIKDGAQLVGGIEDVLEGLGQVGEMLLKQTERLNEKQGTDDKDLFGKSRQLSGLKLSETEQSILGCLDHEEKHIDEIARLSKTGSGAISAAVTQLQLKGLLKQLPGSYYKRAKG